MSGLLLLLLLLFAVEWDSRSFFVGCKFGGGGGDGYVSIEVVPLVVVVDLKKWVSNMCDGFVFQPLT